MAEVESARVSVPRLGLAESPRLTQADYRAAFSVGLLALLLYGYTLAPTVTGEDSGELIGAAYTLGIPHPPGYPVWTLLAHGFTWLPLGSVGWRVNFFSACCGALTLAVLTLIGSILTGNRRAAALGAAIFGVSGVFWEQSLIAEVYTLNTLVMAALLFICVRGFRGPRDVYLLALLAGVSLGVHNTMVLLAPFWVAWAWLRMPAETRRSARTWAGAAVLFLLGAAVYVYLPLASLRDPAVDWGDPETMQRWWDVVRRDQFAFMVDQYPRSLPRFAGQLATMAYFGFRDYLGLGALLGLWGGWLLYRRDRMIAGGLAGMAVVTVVAAVLMQNFAQSREWWWVMRVFMLPAELATAIGIMCALAWGGGGRRRAHAFLVGIGAAAILSSLVFYGPQSKRGYFYAEDYARNILATLPPDTIYVPSADHQAFTVLYLQVVEGLRPDVTLLRKYGYLDLFGVPGLAGADPEHWRAFPPRRYEPEILGWLLEHTRRPLVLSQQLPIRGGGATFRPIGLLVQALRPGEPAAAGLSLDALAWRRPLPGGPVEEYSLSLIQYDVAEAQARMAFAAGDTESALAHLAAAAEFGHREPDILNNIGVLCGRNQAWDAAAGYFREVLERDPEHEAAQRNLERVERRRALTGKP